MKKKLIPFLLIFFQFAHSQLPVIKVDLNIGSRQASEVNDPLFTAWPISTVASTSDTIQGVVITLTGLTESLAPSTLTSGWYKTGIQSPYYARLSCDGIVATVLEMKLSGLPAGNHTLLTYHNTYDSPTAWVYNPVRLYLNNVLVDSLMPSNREVVLSKVPVSYLTFNVTEGQDITLRISPKAITGSTYNKVTLSGFELNTPNSMHQAYLPYPTDRDVHANGDNGSITLKWNKATTAVSHDLYFGTDSATVAGAGIGSSVYKGNKLVTDTSYLVSNLYNINKYFWRVDEKKSDGTITKGNTWYFRNRKPAFEGAEGYGRFAIGGRGGKVVEVTNLNDDGPGSLRAAVTNEIGPRTIVFSVSGIITLNSRLTLGGDNITIAGQTAPGKGICIRQAPFGLSGSDDVIVQNIRVRLGSGATYDGTGMQGSNHCIMDHCSVSWTIDESFSSRSGKNITLQKTMLAEALNAANHQNYPAGTEHGYAASIGGDVGSFHHNLLAHCYGRNWSLAGGLDGSGVYIGRIDIRNNVVYNWGARATDGGAMEVNFVNNYYKPGASTSMFYALNAQHEAVGTGMQRYYFAGNVMPGKFDESNQTSGRKASGETVSYETFVNSPFFESYVTTQTAKDAYKQVLSDVGCTQPVFDDHDKRMIQETLNGTYAYTGSITGKKGLPDSEQDVGGWESYPVVNRDENFDTDHDGLPNWWENLKGTNVNSASGDFSDSNADVDKNGYTNLEEYLQWMMLPHHQMSLSGSLDVDLGQYSAGYVTNPVFTLNNSQNCTTSLINGTKTVRISPVSKGLGSFRFTVTDSEGSSLSRTINLFVADSLTGMSQKSIHSEIEVYPNPVLDLLHVKYNVEDMAINNFSVFDFSGQKIIENKLIDIEKGFSVKNLKAGIYIIKIGDKTQRFIKY